MEFFSESSDVREAIMKPKHSECTCCRGCKVCTTVRLYNNESTTNHSSYTCQCFNLSGSLLHWLTRNFATQFDLSFSFISDVLFYNFIVKLIRNYGTRSCVSKVGVFNCFIFVTSIQVKFCVLFYFSVSQAAYKTLSKLCLLYTSRCV